jgi:hypothetical protein
MSSGNGISMYDIHRDASKMGTSYIQTTQEMELPIAAPATFSSYHEPLDDSSGLCRHRFSCLRDFISFRCITQVFRRKR